MNEILTLLEEEIMKWQIIRDGIVEECKAELTDKINTLRRIYKELLELP